MRGTNQVTSTNFLSNVPAIGVAITAALLFLALGNQEVFALIVQTWDGEGTPQFVNTTAPADDPGWNNISSNRSSIYLGNQWVITAAHAGTGSVVLPSGTYPMIPNSDVFLTNPSNFAFNAITSNADIKMFRIGLHPTTGLTPEEQDPSIKDISITSSSAPFDTEVLMIGAGQVRTLNTGEDSFNGQTDYGNNDWGFGKRGSGSTVKTWGTNKIASTFAVSGIKNSGNNVLIEFSGTLPNDVIGQLVSFDREFDNNGNPIAGSTPDEAMASGGDSGGPVFYKDDNDDWQLLGLMHGIYADDVQQARFGDVTGISDFSHYKSQIETLLASNQYSEIGDLNLDGSVTGEIINGSPTGDLAEMISNWGYTQESGDIHSWMKGDLNQDGTVDLQDFAMMRDGLGGTISTSQIATLVAVATAVPEPSTAMMLLLLGSCYVVRPRLC